MRTRNILLGVICVILLVSCILAGILIGLIINDSKNSPADSQTVQAQSGETQTTGEQSEGSQVPETSDVQPGSAENDGEAVQTEPAKAMNVSVQQIDASAFPDIRLYLKMEDSMTNEIPKNLEQAMFYVRKEDANAQYIEQKISKVTQLNEEEALNINMVADVSGSMEGSPLQEAKSIMSNFVNSVQFSSGDKVELTVFSTGVCIEQEFCSDAGLLVSDINSLVTDDMTSLYDALYTAVTRVASQQGAKCVIAFTDGLDNYSSCSKETVIETAQRYQVPIFIIGIGDADYTDASGIAGATGGKYYNVYDIYSMESIYDEIYRLEKELYLVEFTDATGMAATDISRIQVGYNSPEYVGECAYDYTPNILMNVEAGALYQNGPEAVVEGYIKGFDDAITTSDFSYISGYMKPGSSIYQMQEKYIRQDVTENLDSYEIVDVSYVNTSECLVTTRETYYVQVKGSHLNLMTQQCVYRVVNENSQWQMTEFVDIKVLSRINQ